MAVIKIVPMPGAVGDKGDPGETGPQGPQGQTGQTGQNGQDALWSYQGAWQSNAAYAVGDLVTYEGQLYYAKAITTTGTLPTDTSKFDLIAAKGADGTNGTPASDWAENTYANSNEASNTEFIHASGAEIDAGDTVRLYTGGPTYIVTSVTQNSPAVGLMTVVANGLSFISGEAYVFARDFSPHSTKGTWNLIFNTGNGTLVESAPANGTYAEYYTIGELVYFDMQYSFANVTNYGSSYYLFNLPFPPRNPNNFSNNTLVTGLVVDTTSPDSGSNVIYGSIQTVHPATLEDGGWVLLNYQDTANQMELTSVTFNNPASLSGVQANPASRVRVSGVYRKA